MQRRLFTFASALALLLSFFVPIVGAPQAAAQPSVEVQRITGEDQSSVASAASRAYAAGQHMAFIVATGAHADAMLAASRAGGVDAPVLFVEKNAIPSSTASALTRLEPERIVVVGGSARVSGDVVRKLNAYAITGSVERISGENRYKTSAALATRFSSGVNRVYVASGQGYIDALSGAALAGYEKMPLMLTRNDRLDQATIAQLKRLAPQEIVVLGGENAVSESVHHALTRYTGGTTRRVAGANRYETAAQIARNMPVNGKGMYVANGTAYSDALVAAALAGRSGQPLVLTRPTAVPATSQTAIRHHEPAVIYAVGTREAITGSVINQLKGDVEAAAAGSCQGIPSTDTKFGVSFSTSGHGPTQTLSNLDASFGKVPVLRDFSPGLPRAWDSARARATRDRDVVISFKAAPSEVVSGRHDAFFRSWFATAPDDQTIYWSYLHEPEVKVKNGQFTPAQYRAAWVHLDRLADEACKPNMFPTLILTSWTIDPRSGRDWRDYDPGKDVVEVVAFDPYNALHNPQATTYTSAEKFLGPLAETMEKDGRAWGLAELGSRVVVGDDGRKRAVWLSELGTYLVEHEASFATYFNTTYKGVHFTLDDAPSEAAWSKLVRRLG